MTDIVVPQNLIPVSQFGAIPGASAAINTAAILAAYAAGVTGLLWQQGTYAMTAGTNLAKANVVHKSVGRTILDYSAGAGNGLVLDAGGAGAFINNMEWDGFYVQGGPSITNAIFERGLVRSVFRRMEAKNATNSGWTIAFGVLNEYDHCIVSDDTGLMTTIPTHYFYLDNDGTVGNHTQACTFTCCESGGKSTAATSNGWSLMDASQNTWRGGTAESHGIGINILNDQCRNNSWINVDIEDNRTNDIIVKGFGNTFIVEVPNSASSGNTVDITTGVNTRFFGGYARLVNLGAGSSNTAFFGVHFENNGALGIQGTGTYRAYGCTNGNGFATSVPIKDVLGTDVTGLAMTVSQPGVIAATITKSEALLIGSLLYLQVRFTFTANGTTANAILVDYSTLGLNAKATSQAMPVGRFIYTKGAAITEGSAIVQIATGSATELAFFTNGSNNFVGVSPAFAIAIGDTIDIAVLYPAA